MEGNNQNSPKCICGCTHSLSKYLLGPCRAGCESQQAPDPKFAFLEGTVNKIWRPGRSMSQGGCLGRGSVRKPRGGGGYIRAEAHGETEGRPCPRAASLPVRGPGVRQRSITHPLLQRPCSGALLANRLLWLRIPREG